jgi:hypothetical protein
MQTPENAGNDGPDGETHSVTQLQDGQGARQSRGARRPAPAGQLSPNLDEGRRARMNTPIACANMEPFHRLLLRRSLGSYGAGHRDVDKTKCIGLILTTI